jgi:hypothetical protein
MSKEKKMSEEKKIS